MARNNIPLPREDRGSNPRSGQYVPFDPKTMDPFNRPNSRGETTQTGIGDPSVANRYGLFKPGTQSGGMSSLAHSGGSSTDFLNRYLSSGAAMTDNWRWAFDHVRNREDVDYANEWSMYLQQFAADLGIETAGRSREQIYNQLIGMGMSPSAAMQAAAGIESAGGAGAGGASASVSPSSASGSSVADYLGAAASVVGTFASAGIGIAGLAQQARKIQNEQNQFYDQLKQNNDQFLVSAAQRGQEIDLARDNYDLSKEQFEWNKKCWDNLYGWQSSVNSAYASDEMAQLSKAFVEHFGDFSDDDLVSSRAILAKILSVPELKKLYNAGLDEHGNAWNTAFQSYAIPFSQSIDQEVNNRLAVAQTKQALSVAKLNGQSARLAELQADLASATFEYQVDYDTARLRKGAYEFDLFADAYEQLYTRRPWERQELIDTLVEGIKRNADAQYYINYLQSIQDHVTVDFINSHPWIQWVLGAARALGFGISDVSESATKIAVAGIAAK